MTTLLRAELLKLRTTRTFVTLVGCNLGLSLLLVVLAAVLGNDYSEQEARDLFTSDFTALFILILGVLGMAGEWRHRTITGTVLAAPRRLRFVAAKTLSYAVAGVVMSLVVTLAIMVVGSLILSARGEETVGIADLADVLWRNLVVAALLGALGVCVGGILRNQVVAIVGLLVFSFALEPAVIGLAPDVGRFGPTGGAPNGILGIDLFEDGKVLTPGVALLVMIGWVSAAFAATFALLRTRDLV